MSEAQPFNAEIIGSISNVPAKEWDACTRGNPFTKHAFLEALEVSGSATPETGWQPYHIRLTEAETGNTAGFLPGYIKAHSYGEYVFDHAWANAYEHAGGQYYPKLQISVPFTPVTAPKLLTRPDISTDAKIALLQSTIGAVQQSGLSSAHLTFITEDEARLAAEAGFLIRQDQQFHWQNKSFGSFDEFLSTLSSRKRKQIRKERRTAVENGIAIHQLQGADIKPQHWDRFFEFYQDTGARKWGQPYLTREFFEQIHHTMPDDIILFLCEREGSTIAGALNFKGPDALYGRYWGCLEDHPCLHFETCYYQAIDYAIEHGLKTVEAGAQGPHKLSRGYVPTVTYSAHWIPHKGFRDAVARFLEVEKQELNAEIEFLSTRAPFKKA